MEVRVVLVLHHYCKVPDKLSVNGGYYITVTIMNLFLNFITKNIVSLRTVSGGWEREITQLA